MGITPLALLLDEFLDEKTEELVDERIEELVDERTEELVEDLIDELLEGTILLDEERTLDELAELGTPQLPTMPNGEGWETQVEVEIQLLLFS